MRDIDYDDLNWMAAKLKIITKSGDLVNLRANEAQLKVHNTLEAQRRAGFPVRALILKARQEGVSTYTEARFFKKVNTNKRHTASVVSADLDSTNKVFKMVRLFQDHIPDPLKTDYSNRKEITYAAPHMGGMMCQTAGKDVLGRGGTTHYLHLSEFAFWNNAKEQLGGAMQEVPSSGDTEVIIESTANGVGGAFYDMYMQAYEDWLKDRDLRNFLPIFLPWFELKEYRKDYGVQPGIPDAKWVLDEWVADEEELVNSHHVTPEQLAWRRWAIKNMCQGDLGLFRQEYPATVLEAFQASGRPVFSHSLLDKQKPTQFRKYGLYGERDGEIEWLDLNRRMNCWILAEKPHPYHQYAVALDTMEGRIADPKDEKSKQDRHAAMIYDRSTNRFVGLLWCTGEFTQKDIARQCYWACREYNDAWFAPEIPNGMEVLNYFREKGYDNLFGRQVHDESLPEEGDNLGWRTTAVTRPWLVEGFRTTLSEGIDLNFPELIDEMRSFIYDKTGKPIHMPGKHDDILFAAMIAVEAHKKCPLDDVPIPFATVEEGEVDTFEDVDEIDEEQDLFLFTE